MDLGEYIFMSVFLVLFIGAILFGIRVILALIKRGWSKLVNPRKEEAPVPQVKQPPKPPVAPQPQGNPVTTPIPEGSLAAADRNSWTPHPVSAYQLRVLNGPLMGRTYPLALSGSHADHTIGRHPACSICFPPDTPGISGNHCRVVYENFTGTQFVSLTDCGSTYGTYLSDGQRLQPNQRISLKPGSTFYLAEPGGTALRLERT